MKYISFQSLLRLTRLCFNIVSELISCQCHWFETFSLKKVVICCWTCPLNYSTVSPLYRSKLVVLIGSSASSSFSLLDNEILDGNFIQNCQIHVIRTIKCYRIPHSGDLNILPLQPWTKPTKTQICDWYSLEILSEQRMFVYPLTSKLAYFYDKANTLQQGHNPPRKSLCRVFYLFQFILRRAAIGVTD